MFPPIRDWAVGQTPALQRQAMRQDPAALSGPDVEDIACRVVREALQNR